MPPAVHPRGRHRRARRGQGTQGAKGLVGGPDVPILEGITGAAQAHALPLVECAEQLMRAMHTHSRSGLLNGPMTGRERGAQIA